MLRSVVLVCMLAESSAAATSRRVTIQTYDGRTLSGEVVMESTQGLVLKTASGTELVPWSAISSTLEDSGTSFERPRAAGPEVTKSQSDASHPARTTHVGLTTGVGPGLTPRQDITALAAMTDEVHGWHVLELGFFVQFEPSEVISVRLGVPLTPGLVTRGPSLRPLFKGFFGIDSQLRVNFTERFSSGIGFRFGASVSGQSSPVVGYASLAPSVTPLAVRFGSERQLEVSLDAVVFFAIGSAGGMTVLGFDGLLGLAKFALHF